MAIHLIHTPAILNSNEALRACTQCLTTAQHCRFNGAPDLFRRFQQVRVIKVRVACSGFDASVSEQLADHRQAFSAHGRMTGECVSKIVQPKIPKASGITNVVPGRMDIGDRLAKSFIPEDPGHLG